MVSQNLAPSANLQERQVASMACWRQSSSLDGKNLLLQEDYSTSLTKIIIVRTSAQGSRFEARFP